LSIQTAIKDAASLMPDARRGFCAAPPAWRRSAFLTGCDIIDGDTADRPCCPKISASTTAAGAVQPQ